MTIAKKTIIALLIATQITGCSTTPTYLPSPTAKKSASDYKREQISSPASKQVAGAALSGVIGGLLGPIGILVTSIGTATTNRKALISTWQSFSNTRMVGVVVEDVSKKRIGEYLSNPRWFKDLPPKDQIPAHFSVDFGSGSLLMVPVSQGIMPQIGDVVTVYAPPHAWHLVSVHAEFSALPQITEIRCHAQDKACIDNPDNEPGILEHLGTYDAN